MQSKRYTYLTHVDGKQKAAEKANPFPHQLQWWTEHAG